MFAIFSISPNPPSDVGMGVVCGRERKRKRLRGEEEREGREAIDLANVVYVEYR